MEVLPAVNRRARRDGRARYHLVVGISLSSGFVVAIDGPSGSGKSSAARGVARSLGLRYLDTGAMYRALTWWLMSVGADTADERLVAARAAEPVIEVCTDPDHPWTRVNGQDVSREIRTEAVSALVSVVARVQAVRDHLIAAQRADHLLGGRRHRCRGARHRHRRRPQRPAQGVPDRRPAGAGAAPRGRAGPCGRRDRGRAGPPRPAGRRAVGQAADAVLLDATDLTLAEVIEEIARLARERSELACAGDTSS